MRPDSLGSPVTFDVPHSDGQVCWYTTSDGNGFVLVEAHFPSSPGLSLGWSILASDGTRSGTLQGIAAVAPQPAGFQSTYVYFDDTSLEPQHEATALWSESGAIVKRLPLGSDFCGPEGAFRVPGGGSVAMVVCGAGPTGNLSAFRVDANGNALMKDGVPGRAVWVVHFPSPPPLVESFTAVGDTSGNMLILGSPGSMVGLQDDDYAAQWFDPYGAPLTRIFSAAKGSGAAMLRPLTDGSVALQVGGVWVARLSAGSTEAHAVPDWLSSHPNFDFEIVRGGRAYALLPRNGAAHTDSIEFVAASGESCGSTTFPIGGLSIGFDGTVIAASGDAGCTKSWWTGLLK